MEYVEYALDIMNAVLVILGALKLVARYTKWTWDDAILEKVEAPLRAIYSFFRKPPQGG